MDSHTSGLTYLLERDCGHFFKLSLPQLEKSRCNADLQGGLQHHGMVHIPPATALQLPTLYLAPFSTEVVSSTQ